MDVVVDNHRRHYYRQQATSIGIRPIQTIGVLDV